MVPANKTMPGISRVVKRESCPCRAAGASLATPKKVKTRVMRASGTLMKKIARQPNAPARTPPSGRPMTVVTWEAMEKFPRTRPGTPVFSSSARFLTSAMAVG